MSKRAERLNEDETVARVRSRPHGMPPPFTGRRETTPLVRAA